MFFAILNAMLSQAPAFIRAAVGWLIDGLRSITNYVSARWNELGNAISAWYQRVVYWAGAVAVFASLLRTFVTWLILVRIPGVMAQSVDAVVGYVNAFVRGVRDGLLAALGDVRQWVTDAVAWLRNGLASLEVFVRYWLDRVFIAVSNLVGLLGHVLNGPVVLAEWLVGAMWAAMLRLVYRERDRIFSWLTRESVAFTGWFTRELENVILRWL